MLAAQEQDYTDATSFVLYRGSKACSTHANMHGHHADTQEQLDAGVRLATVAKVR